jgi:hypothetical protein
MTKKKHLKTEGQTICLQANYSVWNDFQVTLPEGKTWNDVEEFGLKWSTFSVRFKGDKKWTEIEAKQTNEGSEHEFYKRPTNLDVYECDENQEIKGDPIATQSQ